MTCIDRSLSIVKMSLNIELAVLSMLHLLEVSKGIIE